VQHLVRHFTGPKKLAIMEIYDQAIKPFTADKGLGWEASLLVKLKGNGRGWTVIAQVNIDEADQLTWHENGMSPPVPLSDGEA
jgi:hypothetical protein